MAFEWSLLVIFIIVAVVIALAAMFFWGVKHALFLAVNSVIGFFALYALQAWWLPTLVINIWSVLIVAVFGLIGLLAVLLLHFLGILF